MVFRFYSNAISQASRSVAAGVFIVGLLLIGFGVVIVAMPALFAILAAGVFFIAGVGCAVTAVKIFWMLRKIGKSDSEEGVYRKNVTIHREEHFDI